MVKLKTVFVGTMLFLGSTILFFIVAEGITRLVMPTSVKLRIMHQPDEKLGYKMAPHFEMRHVTTEFDNIIKINSEGLRDVEHKDGKDPSSYRILVLGDSFTFGLGVDMEESYPKVLESMLNKNPLLNGDKKRFEVINSGIQGFGTEQEFLYLKELGEKYKPDLVILGLYTNDINDVMKGIPSGYIRSSIKNQIYFLSYLRGLQILLSKNFKEIKTEILQLYQDTYPPEFENAIRKTKEFEIKIRDYSASIGAKTMVIIIPLSLEIDRVEWEKKGFGHLYKDDFFSKNMTKFSDMFTEFGKINDIPTLPLLEPFRNSTIKPLYYTHDTHWNKDGHRLAAESMYNFLIERELISSR